MFACVHIPGLPAGRRPLLKECAQAFSPMMEEPAQDLIVFDIRGLQRLFGKPHQIASAIADRAKSMGLAGNVAVASNPAAAITAARGYTGITVIPPGQESRMLGALPLALLAPDDAMLETLEAWGIRDLAALAALPERGLFERLGNAGLRLQKLARGVADRPLLPAVDPLQFEASMELEHPLELLEPLSFVLSRLLHEICGRLAEQSLSTNALELRLRLENGSEFMRAIRLPFANRDSAAFLKLLQYDLAAHPPPAPIAGVHLKANPAPQRVTQNGLFIPLAPQAEKLELTLVRIAAVVGEHNVGTPELLDTHRPGAHRMKKFEARTEPPLFTELSGPRLGIRLFRPPLRADVLAPFGHPQRIQARGVSGKVVAYAGPWRTSGDWWTVDPWDRDEWDVSLQNGAIYRIFQGWRRDWFVEGNYD